ncbi:MAG TPA: methyltransferase domain-containing protein [Oligoflexus sp.]|uniref:class I SAM-dependent methyltransferase n=1 Tax=Oligoflexus sp. TaxID=1971216 RepID=UPI002D68B2D0|nr:methyltransferase domain-containing protein [Oligoflexus sp.]HYX34108.1 methyltransferase domain-containing protein [Oligoflexus sp.]
MQGSKLIHIEFMNELRPIRVVDSFDDFLDDFATEVGGQLTDERCPFGVLLWPSARIVARWLVQEAPWERDVPLKIIELGCGVGFLSCALATLFPNAEIIACDYEARLEPYVNVNAAAWGVSRRVEFRQVDWRQAVPQKWKHQADWVLGADVFYDDSHLKHLPPFARDLLKADGLLTLADPKRFRFGTALDILKNHFTLRRWVEEDCDIEREGIEDFMVSSGVLKQKVSILEFAQRSRS